MTLGGSLFAAPDNAMADDRLITDFTRNTADLGWYVVNDNVMGGRSDGGFSIDAGELLFEGRTNTRGGGFSSIRTREARLDLSEHTGIRLRILGDGRRYTWRLTTDARVYGRPLGYWADFETVAGEWTTVDVPFSRFIPQFRGYRLDGPALDPARISGMGLMIYDGRDGPFNLKLGSLHAYAEPARFSFDTYRWQKRVLVVGAASSDDEHLEQLLEAIAASRQDFDDRDMLLVTLIERGMSKVGDDELTAEQAKALREELDIAGGAYSVVLIGKDGTVKLASNEAVPMADIYALVDAMPMRRRELESSKEE